MCMNILKGNLLDLLHTKDLVEKQWLYAHQRKTQ